MNRIVGGTGSVIWWGGVLSAISAFAYVPSGGIAFGGAATTGVSQHLAYTPTGGIAYGGAAATSFDHTDPEYTPTGGIAYGGSAAALPILTHPYAPSGGIAFAGAATAFPILSHRYTPSGGIAYGGAATTESSIHKEYTPTGGIAYGGAGPTLAILSHIYTPSGGIAYGGAAVAFFRGALVELYPNNAETTLTGNYTAGDGKIDVVSTASPFKPTGSYRLALSNPANGAVRVVLRVLTIFSSTRFLVEPEGPDANAFTGDFATAVNSEGAMYATRADTCRSGSQFQLPSSGISHAGDEYFAIDGYHYRYDGSNWTPFGDSIQMARPVVASFSARNVGSAGAVDSPSGIVFSDLAAESGLHGWELASPGGAWLLKVRLLPLLEIALTESPSVGIYVRNSSSGALRTIAIRNNQVAAAPGLYLGVDDWTNETTFNTAVFGPLGLLLQSDGIWLAIAENGSNVKTFSVMADGVNLNSLQSGSFTADKVGFYVETTGSARLLKATLKSWLLG